MTVDFFSTIKSSFNLHNPQSIHKAALVPEIMGQKGTSCVIFDPCRRAEVAFRMPMLQNDNSMENNTTMSFFRF